MGLCSWLFAWFIMLFDSSTLPWPALVGSYPQLMGVAFFLGHWVIVVSAALTNRQTKLHTTLDNWTLQVKIEESQMFVCVCVCVCVTVCACIHQWVSEGVSVCVCGVSVCGVSVSVCLSMCVHLNADWMGVFVVVAALFVCTSYWSISVEEKSCNFYPGVAIFLHRRHLAVGGGIVVVIVVVVSKTTEEGTQQTPAPRLLQGWRRRTYNKQYIGY